jgi:hypothetical protein
VKIATFDKPETVSGKHMRQRTFIKFGLSLFVLTSFQADNGLEKFKMTISKTKLVIDIPTGQNQVMKLVGGHGEGYNISYPDSSLIYFSNDKYVATPNYKNLETIKWKPLPGMTYDTTLFGQSSDGTYWKEIQMRGKWLGYLNVTADKKDLFDNSLKSLRPKKIINTWLKVK